MKTPNYINKDLMFNQILNIYKAVRESFTTSENSDVLYSEISDDFLDDYTQIVCDQINKDMGAYLNGKDHHLPYQRANIDYDYLCDDNKDFCNKSDQVNEMIKRLNNNEESETADRDRNFLVSWFFKSFGIFGLRYNFENYISEVLYQNGIE